MLVVDVHPRAEAIATALQAGGFTVEIAEDAEDARRRDEERPADALVVDLAIADAVPLVAVVCDPRRPARPVLVSAEPNALALIRDALRAGADDFVTHPVVAEALVVRLQARLGLRSTRNTAHRRAAATTLNAATVAEPSFCPVCATLREAETAQCERCQADAPFGGWPPLAACPWPDLGTLVASRYLLDQHLGVGRSGHVYRARDLFLGRHYSAKLVDLTGRSAERRAAAEREAEALARVRSPHVIDLYEVHTLPDDRLLLITEFVDGWSLRAQLDRGGPLAPPSALATIRQVALGLHAAHAVGVLHRDVKPENVMLETLPTGGFHAWLSDFGLARVGGALERRDAIFATPRYAAPEQLLDGGVVDERSDVCGLGLTLYTALTASAPLGARTIAGTLSARRSALESGLNALRIPSGSPLRTLIDAMTADAPSERPQDMGEVIRRMDEVSQSLESS